MAFSYVPPSSGFQERALNFPAEIPAALAIFLL